MGTRASFFVGDPRDLEKREWLGCIAFDGYPEGVDELDEIGTEKAFKKAIRAMEQRDDFASPKGGFPFPWPDDLFLTDYTYAFFDGKLQVACGHRGFVEWGERNKLSEMQNSIPSNIPAPGPYDPSQPDSIMIFVS